ncbi:MAG: hypothetical protein BGO70_01050 [Bacteroidetes bacterium 43-93]|nr:MAG: hypothetical protein BGO70_01050 [Bacteroidetes bacterium 43-93]
MTTIGVSKTEPIVRAVTDRITIILQGKEIQLADSSQAKPLISLVTIMTKDGRHTEIKRRISVFVN